MSVVSALSGAVEAISVTPRGGAVDAAAQPWARARSVDVDVAELSDEDPRTPRWPTDLVGCAGDEALRRSCSFETDVSAAPMARRYEGLAALRAAPAAAAEPRASAARRHPYVAASDYPESPDRRHDARGPATPGAADAPPTPGSDPRRPVARPPDDADDVDAAYARADDAGAPRAGSPRVARPKSLLR